MRRGPVMDRKHESRLLACLALASVALAAPACSDDGGSGGVAVPLDWHDITAEYQPGALLSGWAAAPDDVWAVGGERGRSVALHYDGATWTDMDPGLDERLWWVHGFEGGRVFVVGDHGAAAYLEDDEWTITETGVPGTTLYGVWGTSPDDVWAVGGPAQVVPDGVEREGFVVLRFDGTAWTRVEIDALADKPASQGTNLFKVWGANADDVFIVGDSGLALHYDGQTWTEQSTGANDPLFTVVGRSADDVYAVGGLVAPVMVHWDGTAWSMVDLPPLPPEVMQGVWTAPGEAVYVGGWYGYTASLDIDGTWEVMETGSDLAYHAVFGDGSGGLWAVGGDIYSQLDDHVGTIITTQTSVPSP